jgi:heat shock protein HslJ
MEVEMQPIERIGRVRRRSLARALGGAILLVVLVAACGGAAATPSLGPISNLDGTNWRLISYLSPTGTNFTVPAAVTPSATFSNGQLSANSGCNTASATYTLTGTTIKIGPLAATQKACQDPIATVETAYFAALSVVDTAVGNDSTLILKQSNGFTALQFVRAN